MGCRVYNDVVLIASKDLSNLRATKLHHRRRSSHDEGDALLSFYELHTVFTMTVAGERAAGFEGSAPAPDATSTIFPRYFHDVSRGMLASTSAHQLELQSRLSTRSHCFLK